MIAEFYWKFLEGSSVSARLLSILLFLLSYYLIVNYFRFWLFGETQHIAFFLTRYSAIKERKV